MTINEFIRYASLGTEYKSPVLQAALAEIHRELTAQGRNFNQIAKLVNTESGMSDRTEALLKALHVPLVRALSAVSRALEPAP